MTAEDPPRWLPPTWADESQPPPPPEPSEPRPVPVWVPFVALLAALLIISLFAALLGGIVAAADPSVNLSDDTPLGVLFGVMAVQYIVFAAAALVTLKLATGRIQRVDLGLTRVRNVWPAIGWAALVFVAFLAIYCVLICMLAPFFEELFFRGFMYTIMWRRLGPIWAALIVGALFGLGHAGDAPWLSVAALGAFGVGLCLLYWRTQSIVPGMALHALNNSITFGAVKELDPALFLGVVCLSVGVVTAVGTALSSRATVTA
jgi:membrane protease YdiL (CAAX protease family)